MRQGSSTLHRRHVDLGRCTPDGSAEPAPRPTSTVLTWDGTARSAGSDTWRKRASQHQLVQQSRI
eukprot:3679778-Pyramimonas_sp.AAC.1